jgi:hypothetical protein
MPMNAPILFDPLEILIEEAKLLDQFRVQTDLAADDILKKFPDLPHARAAATAFIARIGSNIPDYSIAAAVKNIAIVEFARRGVI